jgi:hypothetical protein
LDLAAEPATAQTTNPDLLDQLLQSEESAQSTLLIVPDRQKQTTQLTHPSDPQLLKTQISHATDPALQITQQTNVEDDVLTETALRRPESGEEQAISSTSPAESETRAVSPVTDSAVFDPLAVANLPLPAAKVLDFVADDEDVIEDL